MTQPHIVALGGTLRPTSATATALEQALAHARSLGARTTLLTGPAIDFPNYEPESAAGHAGIQAFVAALRGADGVIVGSPGYHGTLSGLVKNALDHVELLRRDDRVYFDGMPVGIVATAAGWQAAVATMATLRTVAHALRGWPTPVGVAINTAEDGALDRADAQLRLMVEQMLGFIGR
ncbi:MULTISPECIES: NADPH-dependent FMN reductase [unclassified Sphingomonas]|uniref:NADPH-dependent FMN reductase n=1 Tax=unclassified Sphingomonas TaxID=196159 RepID=UPI000701F3ED|nr:MULTISPECIES: NAD(P)H-dependent oxidoreductase [unclassified Sphingomonas]KQM96757.1 FMN reductase [Sphingomonas sp. Leaf25]KQN39536.1 FMN reductase [Sphingomonas sp. Leaf42]KQT28813.1 FMN reductase [Sphingomonas sp. Leaf407]